MNWVGTGIYFCNTIRYDGAKVADVTLDMNAEAGQDILFIHGYELIVTLFSKTTGKQKS